MVKYCIGHSIHYTIFSIPVTSCPGRRRGQPATGTQQRICTVFSFFFRCEIATYVDISTFLEGCLRVLLLHFTGTYQVWGRTLSNNLEGSCYPQTKVTLQTPGFQHSVRFGVWNEVYSYNHLLACVGFICESDAIVVRQGTLTHSHTFHQ